MQVVIHINLVQLVVPDALLTKNVAHLIHLGMEVEPLLRVILDEHILPSLLSDDEEGADVRIFPALKVAEIALRKELHII